MEIAELFEPVNISSFDNDIYQQKDSLFHHLKIYSDERSFPSDVDVDIVFQVPITCKRMIAATKST